MEAKALALPSDLPRELGTYGGSTDGPLVICLGGIHGNEPAGVVAAQRVLDWLHTRQPSFRGELIALTGNRSALLRQCRYLSHDLNRAWSQERVSAFREGTWQERADPEDEEQRELLTAIDDALARRRGPVIFLDLHTTSAAGIPFTVIADTLLNRQLARSLPAPVILGLEEHLDATTLNYMNDCGYIAVGFEGGQNEAPTSVVHHELAVWMTLITAGCLRRSEVPQQVSTLYENLAQKTRVVPPILEIRYRHAVQPEDQFVMEPGFENFQKVTQGQLLARDRRGADLRADRSVSPGSPGGRAARRRRQGSAGPLRGAGHPRPSVHPHQPSCSDLRPLPVAGGAARPRHGTGAGAAPARRCARQFFRRREGPRSHLPRACDVSPSSRIARRKQHA